MLIAKCYVEFLLVCILLIWYFLLIVFGERPHVAPPNKLLYLSIAHQTHSRKLGR